MKQWYNSHILELAKKKRPEVIAAQALIKKSESEDRLTKKDYAPDLTIGVNYIEVDEGPLNVSDNGKDAYNVMFSPSGVSQRYQNTTVCCFPAS